MKHRHHYHSLAKRAMFSFGLVATVMLIGTIGIRLFEGSSYLDAFYFMSMIATAQGPSVVPQTAAGKIFTAFMAFVSVGSVTAATGFLLGPFFGRLWRIGAIKMEEDLRKLRHSGKR